MADPPVLREQPIRARKRQHLRRLTGAAALCIVGGLLVVWRVVGVGGVTFIDCGVLQLHYDMSTWYSADPQTFGLESVPAGWRGEGIVLGVDEAVSYTHLTLPTTPYV